MKELFYSPVDPTHIKKEKAKARLLRQTPWWDRLISKGICHYCEVKFPKESLTMDHILPIGRGGFSTQGNVVVSCKDCNTKKSHMTPAEMALASLKN